MSQRRCMLAAPATAVGLLLVTPAPAGALFGCGINPLCIIGKGAGGVVSSVAGDAITTLAKAVLGALGHAVEWASTLWVGIGTPPVADTTGQATGTVAFLQQNLLVFTTGLAVLCTLIGAGRIVYHEHKAAQLRELGRYLTTYVLVSAAAAGAASVLIGGSDQMASWFINQASANSSFADHLANLLGLATTGTSRVAGAPAGFTVGLAGTVTTAFIAIALGIVAFLATVIQIMLMLVRGGMLVLLVGTLPLVAAFSNTEMGMQWFRKASAWLIAFALYKPAAAIVYAVAFDLAGQPGALALLDGVMMLVLAILALPALLRFVVPATSALAGGGGAGGMLAGAAGGAIAMRMPTGAASVAATPASAYGQGQSGQSGGPSGAALAGANGLAAAAGMNGGGQSGAAGRDGNERRRTVRRSRPRRAVGGGGLHRPGRRGRRGHDRRRRGERWGSGRHGGRVWRSRWRRGSRGGRRHPGVRGRQAGREQRCGVQQRRWRRADRLVGEIELGRGAGWRPRRGWSGRMATGAGPGRRGCGIWG
jgi:type IV secretion system protein TrbL